MAGGTRIKLPDNPAIGDVIEVRALIQHVMETGNRKDANGQPIPRNIIKAFKAQFSSLTVFSAEFGPGISANPFIAFHLRVPGPGEFVFTWTDDAGAETVERTPLIV